MTPALNFVPNLFSKSIAAFISLPQK